MTPTLTLRTFASLALTAAALVAPWAAHAKDAPAGGPMAKQAAQACRTDFKKFCDGVKPGEGRGLACLKEHQAELSENCKAAMSQAKDCAAQARERCGAEGGDADKRRACLKEHGSELSQCKGAKSSS
ncbi:cysteine rich repeat-containing protein [Roseateles sp. SL47]|uniref:cysteine rich repeat-containing protein n=1 Tax=Roseateles sp. SL47 TaxID=2995138 RepID=UPI00226D9BDA|nr:cysteine rich repeat-containing protein [Roseateles sp. SL47]WAC72677.1 cysteine rich repeat-containing protein [Roseateles sp. SL47]